MRPIACFLIALSLLLSSYSAHAQVVFPGKKPGAAKISATKSELFLGNKALQISWKLSGSTFKPGQLTNKITGQTIDLGDSLFKITLADGRVIDSSKCEVQAVNSFPYSKAPLVYVNRKQIPLDPNSARAGDHFPGWQIEGKFIDRQTGLEVFWRATLRQGANYIRQEFDFAPRNGDLDVNTMTLLDTQIHGARLSGPATGAPLVSKTLFMGIEDPMSSGTLAAGRAQAVLHVGVPIRKGQHFIRTTVLGVAPEGQLRRSFLYYLERERAHPYRPFLHYNSWWDIGCDPKLPTEKWLNNFNEAECLERIAVFSHELVEKRGVVLDSFLFDDGWDDIDTVWEFNNNFPNGFTKLTEAVRKHNIGIGVWLSPFGGYHVKHDRRIAAGRKAGYEIIEHGGFTYGEAGFALSGAKYYKRFLDVTTGFIKNYDVNMFKFDGISRNAIAPPGSPFSSDFQASVQMLRDLREAKHDVFINLTTGTWASPFWMLFADSIWRGESDCNWMGAGSKRQQWITYRDAITYKNIVRGCELYPLNSLMNCGLIYSVAMQPTDPNGDFKDEVRSFFGSGTQLQEMYCAPSVLKAQDWNWIAEGAKWSRKNAGVLVDTHWVGGDPKKLEVYGWAAWTPQGATLTLRNPSDKPQEFTVDAKGAFELPAKAPQKYVMKSAYSDQRVQKLDLDGSKKVQVHLEPFEVMVFEAKASK